MKIKTDPEKIQEVLTRGVEKIYPNIQALEKVLLSGKRIRLYCGYDPSVPTLHLGNAISLRKLSQFQQLGHEVIMLIGDFTGMIGDPTDKTVARKRFTREEVIRNSRTYKKLASKFLKFTSLNPARLLYNSKWNDKLTFLDLIGITSHFTVQQMIIRDMFQERIKKKRPVYLHEFLYPIVQAFDSVAMDVDLEIGGKDQTFNMLCGRALMKVLKNKEKFVLALRLLVDPAGKKMGKTEGNMIMLDEKPEEMFGKVMAWPDRMVKSGFELCTNVPLDEVESFYKEANTDVLNLRDVKTRLAKEIVASCYNEKLAERAEKEFNKVFREKKLPTKIPEFHISQKFLNILDLLVKTKLAPSKSEAKRLILQKGVKIDGEIQKEWRKSVQIKKKLILQVGKRKFAKTI